MAKFFYFPIEFVLLFQMVNIFHMKEKKPLQSSTCVIGVFTEYNKQKPLAPSSQSLSKPSQDETGKLVVPCGTHSCTMCQYFHSGTTTKWWWDFLRTHESVASLGFSIDGFETFSDRSKLPNFSDKTPNLQVFILNFPENWWVREHSPRNWLVRPDPSNPC